MEKDYMILIDDEFYAQTTDLNGALAYARDGVKDGEIVEVYECTYRKIFTTE